MGKRDTFIFDGFEPANTTPVPDVLFDVLLPKLSGAELKVLLYIIRRTWGFKKATDAISISQFTDGIITKDKRVLDEGCGIKRRETVIEALNTLEKMGCVTSQKGKETAGDNATSIYSIHFKEVVSKADYLPLIGGFKSGLPVVSKPDYGSPKTGPRVVSKPDPQETVLQDTDSQETGLQEGTFGANAPTRPHIHLSEMDEDALLCSLAAYRTEQQLTGGHLHIPGNTGTCCLQCEHDALEAIVEEKQEKVKRITDKHKAVRPNETPYHIAESAIRNVVPPLHTTMPAKVPTSTPARASSHEIGSYLPRAATMETAAARGEQTPGTGALPSTAEPPQFGRSHGITSDQATPSLPFVSEPAQSSSPTGSVASDVTRTAQASGHIPKRPRGGKPAVLELSLMGMDVKRWIEDIRGVKVRMTENNVRACNALADTDGVSLEALRAYFEYVEAQKWTVDLLTAAGETKNQNVQFLSFESNWPKLKRKIKGDEKPPQDKYTAASRDKERTQRRLDELKASILANGGTLPS